MLVCAGGSDAYGQIVGGYVHDPSTIIKAHGVYWMFSTGHGIDVKSSADLKTWTPAASVFAKEAWPKWINGYVPDFKGHFWAPECIFMNGKYYLYYSCSTFGSSTSAIGVAVNATLDVTSPDFKWTDLGVVVHSSARNHINAIDPALFMDTDGKVYLTYGSFSNGIGIIEIDPATGKPLANALLQKVAGGDFADWEAAHLAKHGEAYYLFVNRGFCCRKEKSTYRIVVGRSESPTGPFVDLCGVDLNNGGGTEIFGTDRKFIGPGHVALLNHEPTNVVSIHYYDGNDGGKSKLDIINLDYQAGWPLLSRQNAEHKLSDRKRLSNVEKLTVSVSASDTVASYKSFQLPLEKLNERSIIRLRDESGNAVVATPYLKRNEVLLLADLKPGHYVVEVTNGKVNTDTVNFVVSQKPTKNVNSH